MTLKNAIADNTDRPTGEFHGDGRRFHGYKNQLIVLTDRHENLAGKVDAATLAALPGTFYPYGSQFA